MMRDRSGIAIAIEVVDLVVLARSISYGRKVLVVLRMSMVTVGFLVRWETVGLRGLRVGMVSARFSRTAF
jgi:hypothetical protein